MSQGAWHVGRHGDHDLLVTFDCPGRSVNTFSRAVLEELDQLLEDLAARSGIRAVFFRSGKEGNFAAGADLDEVARISDPRSAAELARLGQQVFRKLERLPLTTIALVSGACLGGGLEFALACDYVIADDGPRTLLGFPEVLIGLIPGWGGTVRSRRRLGLVRAVQAVTTASRYNGRQAKRIGLVDDVVPAEALLAAAEWFAHHRPARRKRLSRHVIENRWVGKLMLNQVRKRVLAATHGHYPAPLHAIRAFEGGLQGGVSAQYQAERTAIADLAAHPVTPRLMRIFFLQEEAKKTARELLDDSVSIRSVGVVGAGLMGSGIAALLAARGIEVRLKDIRPELLAQAMQRIRAHFARQVRRGRMTEKEARDTLYRIYPTTDYSGFRHLDLVIEAVVEDVQVKTTVYGELFDAIGPETIVATNTSSFSLSSLQSDRIDPQRFAALHFFNPPHRMRLVEIAWRNDAAHRTQATVVATALRLGKTPIKVGDCHGFIVNRLLTAYLNQVGYLLLAVDDPLTLEEAMVEFGFPMGPLELLDLVGLPVAQKVAANLYAAYGTRMKPAPLFDQLEQQAPGKLLQRSRWKRTKTVSSKVLSAIAAARKQVGRPNLQPPTREALAQLAIAPLLNEAVLMLQEGLVAMPDTIDLAMILGTGFPPFRGGPIAYGDDLGWDRVRELLERLASVRPELGPCQQLLELASSGARLARDRSQLLGTPAPSVKTEPSSAQDDGPLPLSG